MSPLRGQQGNSRKALEGSRSGEPLIVEPFGKKDMHKKECASKEENSGRDARGGLFSSSNAEGNYADEERGGQISVNVRAWTESVERNRHNFKRKGIPT